MQTIGFIAAFILVIFLLSKNVNMGLSLLIATLVMGFTSSLGLYELVVVIKDGVLSSMSIQLMIIIGFISGLGFIMKMNGDLEIIISSLYSLLNNTKVMTMLIPALIGTLNIPGGAILSAPMVEESGSKINLEGSVKSSINLFFRHIVYLVYPLYTATITMVSLLQINITAVMKYTFFVMVLGIASAYFLYFKDIDNNPLPVEKKEEVGKSIIGFISGFLPILIILFLSLVLKLPFHYSALFGVLFAIFKKIPEKNRFKAYLEKIRSFVVEGINYQLVFSIAGLMAFKAVLEATGFVDNISGTLISYGIPLPMMVAVMGFFAGYLTGVPTAAVGIVTPILIPVLLPVENIGVYAALILTTVNVGYLLSPVHLCLILSNQYFNVNLKSIYRKLAIPVIVMVAISLFQAWVF